MEAECKGGLKEIRMNNKGVTLIESMVAAVIVGIGFVAVYGLSTTSTTILLSSIDREKGSMLANTIMEDMLTDTSNIFSCVTPYDSSTCPYNNMDLTINNSNTETYDKKHAKWHVDANKKFGAVAENDVRLITIKETTVGSKVYVIKLELRTRGGRSKNVFIRTING